MLQSDGLNGKGRKGDYGWLQGDVVNYESCFVAACSGMTVNLVEVVIENFWIS